MSETELTNLPVRQEQDEQQKTEAPDLSALFMSPDYVNHPTVKILQEMSEEELRQEYELGLRFALVDILKHEGLKNAQEKGDNLQKLGIIAAVAQEKGIDLKSPSKKVSK